MSVLSLENENCFPRYPGFKIGNIAIALVVADMLELETQFRTKIQLLLSNKVLYLRTLRRKEYSGGFTTSPTMAVFITAVNTMKEIILVRIVSLSS